jgi:hypothetical protein
MDRMDALRRRSHGRVTAAGLALAAAAALWLTTPAPVRAESASATQQVRLRVVAGLAWRTAGRCTPASRCAGGSGQWAIARRERTLTLNSGR